MKLEIREFKPGNEKNYVNIQNEAMKKYSLYRPINVEDVQNFIVVCQKLHAWEIFFAYVDDKPVGPITATMEEPEVGFIRRYQPCVLPEFDVMNIKKALLEATIKFFKEKKAKKVRFIVAGVLNEIIPFISFYENLGFKTWRTAETLESSLKQPIRNTNQPWSCDH